MIKRFLRWCSALRTPHSALQLQVMPEAEKVAAFRQGAGTPVWRATLAELDEFIVEVSDRPCADPKITNEEMRLHVGGQTALTEFREKLWQRELEARRSAEGGVRSAE